MFSQIELFEDCGRPVRVLQFNIPTLGKQTVENTLLLYKTYQTQP